MWTSIIAYLFLSDAVYVTDPVSQSDQMQYFTANQIGLKYTASDYLQASQKHKDVCPHVCEIYSLR